MKKIHYLNPYMQEPTHPITVCLVGCGGTGSNLLTQLGRIHYSLRQLEHPGLMVRVFDPDMVSPSNIGRQLFSKSEVGLFKSNVLTTRINRFYGTDWLSFPTVLVSEEIRSNIIITCVDSVGGRKRIREQIAEYLRYSNDNNLDRPFRLYYWLDTGNTRDGGQIILGTTQRIDQPKDSSFATQSSLPCLFDIHPELDDYTERVDDGPSCSVAEALTKQDLFINSVIAQYASKLIFDLLKERLTFYSGAYVNLSNYRTNPIYI